MKQLIIFFLLFATSAFPQEKQVAVEEDQIFYPRSFSTSEIDQILSEARRENQAVITTLHEIKDEVFEISDEDKARIYNLLEPLANWSVFKLGKDRGQEEVKRRGRATAHIHPMVHLAYAFSNPTLKYFMKKIRKRNFGMVWKRFKKDFARALGMSEIIPYISGFSKRTGINEANLRYFAERGHWEKFIESLF